MRASLFILPLAALASSASAHDAPLAYLEAMEVHLEDCPAINGLLDDGELLRPGWVKRNVQDKLLDRHKDEFLAARNIIDSKVVVFTKTVEELEIIHFMAARSMKSDDTKAADIVDLPQNIVRSDYLCVTMVPELPFMPSGVLLGAVFGKDPDVGNENSPGTLRDGAWVWDDLSPTHIRTLARYTNSFSDASDLPDDVFYPGFYIQSIRRFTPENSPELNTEESDQP